MLIPQVFLVRWKRGKVTHLGLQALCPLLPYPSGRTWLSISLQIRAVQVTAQLQGEEPAALNVPAGQGVHRILTFIIYATSAPHPLPSFAVVLLPLLLLPGCWGLWGPCEGGDNLGEAIRTFLPSLPARGESITLASQGL